MRRLLGAVTLLLVTCCVAPAHAQTIPVPPPPVLPPLEVPAPLQPFVAILSPSTAPACTLVSLLPGLLGQEAASLPVDPRPFLGYLGPALVACGLIPAPTATHVCQIDQAEIDQVRALENQVLSLLGVLPVPAPEGMLVDTLIAANAAANNAVPPEVLQQLSDALACVQASGAGVDPNASRPIGDLPKTIPPAAIAPVAPAIAYTGALGLGAPAVAAPPSAPALVSPPLRPVVAPKPQHWRPAITTLLAVLVAAVVGWAWRAERRDAARWTQS